MKMTEIELLLIHANIVTLDNFDSSFTDGSIAIDKGIIVELGLTEALEGVYQPRRKVDLKGKYVFPGFINSHTHLFQTMFKGLPKDYSLNKWLKKVIRPYTPFLDAETCYLAALAGCAEAIRSGTTTILDYMYAHPQPELSDAIVQAFDQIGIRGYLARGFSDKMFGSNINKALQESVEKVTADVLRLKAKYGSRIWLAPSALWNVSQEALTAVCDTAKNYNIPVTMHLNETQLDNKYSNQYYGQNAIPFLEEIGLLNENFLAVHCVYMDQEGTESFRKHNVKISYNPVSNMILGSGVMNLPLLEGLTVSFGTDGAASNDSQNMLETMKLGAILQKVHYQNPAIIDAKRIVQMATLDGARALGLEKETGSLEKGKKADMLIYDALQPQSFTMHNPLATLVYASNPGNIDSVIIDGKEVMINKQFVTIDEERILHEAQVIARKLITH